MISIKTNRDPKLDYNDLPQKRQLPEPQRCGSNFEPVKLILSEFRQ
jgi:hypothetical protein